VKTVVLEKPGQLAWRDAADPVALPGDAVVRVLRCGVCGTDTHAIAGRQPFFSYPRRLGHELCVEVISAPADARVKPGQLCAVEPYLFCQRCPACLAGRTNCCRELKVLGVHIDGGHAPYLSVSADKLHPSGVLSPDELALVEPLAIGAHGVDRANLKSAEHVVVIGLGPIGLSALIAAKAVGADCVGVDTQPARVAFANRIGLEAIAAVGEWRVGLEHGFSQRPDVVIDATGNPQSMRSAFDLPEQGGRIVFLGLFSGEVAFDDPSFHRRELTLLASRAALPQTFTRVIRLIEERRINASALITHRIAFNDLVERLTVLSQEPNVVKAMIDFPETP
jgi:L-galactonate 5-dehydrogenase